MAYFTIIQGKHVNFTIDATNYGTIDAFNVELGQNNSTKVKYRWPTTDGFHPMVNNNGVFTVNIHTTVSRELLGIYDLELTAELSGEEVGHDISADFMLVKRQNL